MVVGGWDGMGWGVVVGVGVGGVGKWGCVGASKGVDRINQSDHDEFVIHKRQSERLKSHPRFSSRMYNHHTPPEGKPINSTSNVDLLCLQSTITHHPSTPPEKFDKHETRHHRRSISIGKPLHNIWARSFVAI